MKRANRLGCTHPRVARRPRQGLLDTLMARMGKYPWTCRLCGCTVYFRDRRPGELGGEVRSNVALAAARFEVPERRHEM